jgi:hypothetical protein
VQPQYFQISGKVSCAPAEFIADFLYDERACGRLFGEANADFAERIWPILHPQKRKIAVKPDMRMLGDLAKEQRINVFSHGDCIFPSRVATS